nr:uncharacterized mitochondrial protein AtMg00810-like [Tanacetum cinerariifolium]
MNGAAADAERQRHWCLFGRTGDVYHLASCSLSQEGTVHGTVRATVPDIVHARVSVTVDATVHGQNSRMAIVHSPNNSPQTPTTVTDEDESEDDDVAIPVRRLTRNKVLPTRLVDYQLNVHELMLTLDEEPRNYNEAKLKPKSLKVMKIEHDSIVKNNIWKLVPLPKGVVPIRLKWLFKIKRNADCSIVRIGEKVYKLVKSLYGLRQAPRAWNIKLDNTLKEMGFQQCMQEKEVYKVVTNKEFINVAVYVADLFMTGTSLDCINEFKKRMTSQFEMSNLSELTYYLVIQVSQGKDCAEIKQERYALKILKEAGIEDCNATLCPIELGLKLSKAENEPKVEAT